MLIRNARSHSDSLDARDALRLFSICAVSYLTLVGAASSQAATADFAITSPNFYYVTNGTAVQNPTLYLMRGKAYTFSINTSSIHPFKINSAGAPSTGMTSGSFTYTVPMAVSNYTYQCTVHGFGGQIITYGPPPAPSVKIVNLKVTTNVVIRSTGTNNWSVNPEYKTDVTSTAWAPLTVTSNFYLLGTNETICGKPPGTNIFIRVRAQ